MRIGIFGGSFNPVHFGHLLLAECCREQSALDEVWFIPAATSPHKIDKAQAPDRQRIEMLELATSGHRAFRVSTLEIDRGGISYTVETLSAIASEHPDAELFLLMGADSLRDLPTWREPEKICKLALPLCVERPDSPALDLASIADCVSPARLRQIEAGRATMPSMGLSATDIRQRVAQGCSIRYQTPRAVEEYIATHSLYQTDGANA